MKNFLKTPLIALATLAFSTSVFAEIKVRDSNEVFVKKSVSSQRFREWINTKALKS